MPPKSKKRKSKNSKKSKKEASRRAAAQDSNSDSDRPPRLRTPLQTQAEEITKFWDASLQREDLVQQVRDKILPQKNVFIDNALCLGLGSMEGGVLLPLPGSSRMNEVEEDWIPWLWGDEKPKSFRPVGNGKRLNSSLYQLVVFETVLKCLEEKFTIKKVLFQDPSFTANDQGFLSERGHEVIPWDNEAMQKEKERLGLSSGYPMDPSLASSISNSTLCFLPFLDFPVVIQVISAARPSLFLGNNLVSNIATPICGWDARSKNLMQDYGEFSMSCDFSCVAAFRDGSEEEFGFMWPANITEEDVQERVQEQNSELLNRVMDSWAYVQRSLDKKKEREREGKQTV